MASRQLINDPKNVVNEMLEGLTWSHPGLQKLDGHCVIARSSLDKSKVQIISGGGSGHEPSHAGWVGTGMLSAAVAGPVFASPSSVSVLAAIMHVTGSGGCLVIVKNYTGDRLWFGLACEQAKAAGLNVELVVVGDDCALADRGLGIAGRRGVAGTCLVHKIAGAAAEAGASLSEVAAAARAAAAAVGTMGVALRTCTLPGQAREERIADGMMEVGLGIHGEPGAMVSPLQPVDQIVDQLLSYITSQDAGRGYLSLHPGDRVAVLVNNLGGSTAMELSIALRRAIWTLEGPAYGVVVERVWSGSLMTALDMVGLSVSVLKLTDSMIAALDLPSGAPAWPGGGQVSRARTAPAPGLPSGAGASSAGSITPPAGAALLDAESSARVSAAITAAARALQAQTAQLTSWDEVCGDGDCGTTLADGANAILADLASYPLAHPASLALALACSLGRAMGGSSGALYSIFLNAVAASLGSSGTTPVAAAAAFAAGCEAMSNYGGAGRGHRTMLDALLPAADAMSAAAAEGGGAAGMLSSAARAAEEGAEATKTMTAGAGRASYVPTEVMKDVPDPGAKAVAFWLAAAAKAIA